MLVTSFSLVSLTYASVGLTGALAYAGETGCSNLGCPPTRGMAACGRIERILYPREPGKIDGLEAGVVGAAAARLAWNERLREFDTAQMFFVLSQLSG